MQAPAVNLLALPSARYFCDRRGKITPMETQPVEIYSESSNSAIVRVPGRKFPGSVIQGDSLVILCDLASSICKRARAVGDDELLAEAEELRAMLFDRLSDYEAVLAAHGLPVPYASRNRLGG